MKKYLVIALALVACVACSKEESVGTIDKAPISFDNAFVNNSTRANDLTADNLTNFGVYATIVNSSNEAGLILTNELVSGSKGSFTYTNTQYWLPSSTYHFTAIAPHTGVAWTYNVKDGKNAQTGTISFNNQTAGANQDLLFAYKNPPTTASAITTQPAAVEFDFAHLLSRVKFTFVNGFASTSNITLKVNNVRITNAHETGTIAVTDGTPAEVWTPADQTLNVPFGGAGVTGSASQADAKGADITCGGKSATTEHFYLIPADANLKVSFDVDLYQAGVLVKNYKHTDVALAINMLKGNSYEIKATLNQDNVTGDDTDDKIYPIVFDVNTIGEWVENPSQDLNDEYKSQTSN